MGIIDHYSRYKAAAGAAIAVISLGLSGAAMADAKLPGTAAPVDKAYLPTAIMPKFAGLGRTDADVCQDGSCAYTSIAQAAKSAGQVDTITVAPGIYRECVSTSKSLAIVGLTGANGERPIITEACGGKAAFVVSGEKFLLKNVRVYKINVRDRNGACVRLEGRGIAQRVAIEDVYCDRSQNGILGSVGDGSLIIRRSTFEFNGANGGQAHGIYVTDGAEVWIDTSTILHSKGQGHSVKVGARRLVITKSMIAGLNGRNSRAIDYYAGGILSIRDSVVHQGPYTDNHDMIGIVMEPRRGNKMYPQGTYIGDSWVIFDDPNRCCRWLMRGAAWGPRVLDNVALVGLNDTKLDYEASASVVTYNSRKKAGLPAYDGTLRSLPAAGAPRR